MKPLTRIEQFALLFNQKTWVFKNQMEVRPDLFDSAKNDIFITQHTSPETFYQIEEVIKVAEACGLHNYLMIDNGEMKLRIYNL